MSTIYGPQLPSRGDVQAARDRWDALAADVNDPESTQAFDDYMTTIRAAEAEMAAQTEAETEVTRLAGTRFAPGDTSLRGLTLTYRPGYGYSLREMEAGG